MLALRLRLMVSWGVLLTCSCKPVGIFVLVQAGTSGTSGLYHFAEVNQQSGMSVVLDN